MGYKMRALLNVSEERQARDRKKTILLANNQRLKKIEIVQIAQ